MKEHINVSCYEQYFIDRIHNSDYIVWHDNKESICDQTVADVELDGINDKIWLDVFRFRPHERYKLSKSSL